MTDGSDNPQDGFGVAPDPNSPAPTPDPAPAPALAPQPWQPQPAQPEWWAPAPPVYPQAPYPAPPAYPQAPYPAPPTYPQAPYPQAPYPQAAYQPAQPYTGGDWVTSQASPPYRASRWPAILATLAIAILAFAGGMMTDRLVFSGDTSLSDTGGANSASLQNFALYNEALTVVRQNFVGRSTLTDQQLLYGSIKGLVDSLGDTGHTTFLTADQYKQFQTQLSSSFAGVGIEMASQTAPYVIARTLPGTPAEKAGFKAGDTITAVDGAATATMAYSDLVSKIRGTAGTSVTITVIHPGSTTPVDIKVTRQTLSLPLVAWGMVPGTHVADIALGEFGQGAYDQTLAAVKSATSAGATGIVFDLRGNPGGYATEAQKVASEFLSSGTVYIQRDASGKQTPVTVDTSESPTALPMAVLVDHNSASASEIVAGALQDNHRAKLIGVTTFGTGTVLTPMTLSDGSVILLGTSDWLTPDGHRIFGVGITPDQVVALSGSAQPTDPGTLTSMTATQFSASTDAELLAAVKTLGQ